MLPVILFLLIAFFLFISCFFRSAKHLKKFGKDNGEQVSSFFIQCQNFAFPDGGTISHTVKVVNRNI